MVLRCFHSCLQHCWAGVRKEKYGALLADPSECWPTSNTLSAMSVEVLLQEGSRQHQQHHRQLSASSRRRRRRSRLQAKTLALLKSTQSHQQNAIHWNTQSKWIFAHFVSLPAARSDSLPAARSDQPAFCSLPPASYVAPSV